MTDRANRVLWIVVGLLLAAAGGFGILAHGGRLDFVSPDGAVLSPEVVALWRRADPWNLAAVIAVGLLLGVGGLILLGKEFRRRGTTRIDDLTHDGERGRTVVRASGLIGGLERDVARARGITSASAVITGHPDSSRVWLRLGLAPGATVEQAREDVAAALRRLADTSGLDPAAVDVTVLPTAKAAARVR